MKNTILKMIGTVSAILMLIVLTQISAAAQDEFNPEEKSIEQTEDARDNAGRLEGVWNIQVTARNCQTGEAIRTFAAMHTYMRGGTLSDFGTGNPPATRSTGMGVWNYESGRRYTTAFQFFRFNADGTFAGKQVSRQEIQLSRFGSAYTAVGTAQVFDVVGNVIANNCSTAAAMRFE